MFDYDAFVVEVSADNAYMVCIDGVYSGTISDNGTVDDSVITFESALSTAIELMLSDDYDITQTDEFVSRTMGRLCRRYTISVNEA